MEKLDLYQNNYPEYERLAKQSTLENAKDDYNDYINCSIDDSIDDNFTLKLEEHVPPYMMSQISGKKIKDPVKASTGVYYDREELRALIRENNHTVPLILGPPLSENLDDLVL